MISDNHRRLREATRAHHERLETRVDILTQIADPIRRRALVERFFGLHAAAHRALEPWLAELPGLDFEGRLRARRFASDLALVGGAPRGAGVIRVDGVGEALGLYYVLEGSTLGGRVIRRQVETAGGSMAGLSFLDPYGEAVGERWRSFLAILQSERDIDAMIRGAVAGFGHAEARLCAAPAHG
ncbi:biliverdin-producing heme oxygenase [uncultured Phenylobacterium sp.]|uniref:biliverdin-producing heme oxygenase n=1 Tax=uncultured Phenylobacterium sp. TaxID=349273 RepID=UPI0025F34068|nr:biliverdin-producing heme oxygenase [uncultured Phenylobacterium sp.]